MRTIQSWPATCLNCHHKFDVLMPKVDSPTQYRNQVVKKKIEHYPCPECEQPEAVFILTN